MRLTPVLLAFTLALPGCGAFSALTGGPDRDVFELLPSGEPLKQCARRNAVELVIEAPKARQSLDTDRIMIRPSALQTQYLPDAQWGDTVPASVQTLLVSTFGNYDAFSHVGRTPLGSSGDFALISEINDYNATVTSEGAVVRLAIDAQMVRESDARVVSRGRFVAQAPSASTKTEDLVVAFDAASKDLVRQMTGWGLAAVGVNAASCR